MGSERDSETLWRQRCEGLQEQLTALRAANQRRELLIKHTSLGVIGWNTAGVIVEWNESASRIFGHTAEEAMGQTWRLIVADEDAPALLQAWLDASRQSGKIVASRNTNVTRDGRKITCEWNSAVLIDADGNAVGTTSLVEDITERTRTEDALKRSEAQFRQVIDRLPHAVGVTVEGRCVYVNDAAMRLAGAKSREELLGRAVVDFIHPDDVARVRERREVLAQGQALVEPTLVRFISQDQRLLDAEVVAMPIEFDDSSAVLNVITDVTEKRTIQAKLMQTDRLSAMGMLAAGVAHEVNNPLAYVIANLDLLANRKLRSVQESLASGELETCREELADFSRMLDMAREGASRVRDIVRDLRSFTQSDERRSLVDIARVLRACITFAHDEIATRAVVRTEFLSNAPPVLASESRLGQLFLNLILNAVQALPPGRPGNRIDVSLSGIGVGKEARVMVRIEDNGTGIDPTTLPRIFEPFFTTKPAGVGTGLGLWICRSIVSKMGGEISVESAPGRTSFLVTIPAYLGPDVIPARTRVEEVRLGAPLEVLIVDDEARILEVLGEALAGDFSPTLCSSGREASALLERGATFDAILCDRVMPDFSGDDLLAWIREHRPNLVDRFVMMTGGEREKIAGIQAAALVDKPFDLAAVRATLRTIAARPR